MDDDGPIYIKRVDHCTRCVEPFGGNRAAAYMVTEKVAYEIFNLGDERFAATSDRQTAPVCAACVTPAEEADSTRERGCEGCGLAMRSQFIVRTGSGRCTLRALRARRRHMRPMSHCVVRGASFKPKRSDSVYCSAACKQRAYRCQAHDPHRDCRRRLRGDQGDAAGRHGGV